MQAALEASDFSALVRLVYLRTLRALDENGRIAETRYPAGTERFEYNDKNERILYVDPEGNVSWYGAADGNNVMISSTGTYTITLADGVVTATK